MIRRIASGVGIVVVAESESEKEALCWAEAGAAGYTTREGSLEDLLAAIERVASGEAAYPSPVVTALFRRLASPPVDGWGPNAEPYLTPREREIMELVEQGLRNKEIARNLCLSLPTVKNHLGRVFKKLEVSNRTDAAARVRERGSRDFAAQAPRRNPVARG